jgi:hypothetical protein
MVTICLKGLSMLAALRASAGAIMPRARGTQRRNRIQRTRYQQHNRNARRLDHARIIRARGARAAPIERYKIQP